MLAVVCWLWKGNRDFKPEHVDVMRRMVARHLTVPHRFVCLVGEGYDTDPWPLVDWVPIPREAEQFGSLQTPEGSGFPSCYRRLWLFSENAALLGDRVLLMDIDAVITANIDHLVQSDAPFVGWRPKLRWGPPRVAGGVYLLKTGAHTEVWEDFNHEGATEARKAGYRGSDQAWISYCLAANCALYEEPHGIESVRDVPRGAQPPQGTCMVHFNGERKPWHPNPPAWVLEHWK